MIKVGSHKILVELKGYIEKNWGFPFIVAFMILLSVTAFSLFWEPYDSGV
jgi:HKD family nuclease